MINRGGFSFVAMLVINPIVILFYQNCSITPLSHAAKNDNPIVIQRGIASEAQKPLMQKPQSAACDKDKGQCLDSSVE